MCTAPIILDPAMIAKGGAKLLQPDAVAIVRDQLLPGATLLTPNLPEATHLLGTTTASMQAEMEAQGSALIEHEPIAVLMKGGHLDGPYSSNCLVTAHGTAWFEDARTPTLNSIHTGPDARSLRH
nr:bifunctional hydroxymethylpyrimidine kinase/phosphomethylpyrimidine kinase [uncultured Tateyamaria sp.]